MEQDISLRELIRTISDELIASRDERVASGRPPVFEVDALDIEVGVVVTRSRTGSGGIDLKVVRGDAERSYENQAVQRVTLHLRAADLSAVPEEFTDFDATTPLRPRRAFE